ncbi:MAG TPA: hypothetical protein VGW77_01330 [Candidatus Binatia bacterium]|nr:hypothetical protein [Candidatus Binatia bacterium]
MEHLITATTMMRDVEMAFWLQSWPRSDIRACRDQIRLLIKRF